MVGLQDFVRGRQNITTPQAQGTGSPHPQSESPKLSRAEIGERARVKPPNTNSESVPLQRGNVDQNSQRHTTNPTAPGRQGPLHQMESHSRDEAYPEGEGSLFGTDVDALEDSTSEIQVEDSQVDTDRVSLRDVKLASRQQNENGPREYAQAVEDNVWQGQETHDDSEGESQEEDDEEGEESGSSSVAEDEEEMSMSISEQRPQAAQLALQTHLENEVSQPSVPFHNQLFATSHTKAAAGAPSNLELSGPYHTTVYQDASYPSTTTGEPEEEDRFRSDARHAGLGRRPQEPQNHEKYPPAHQRKYQQPKLSSRPKEQKDQQRPQKPQSAQAARSGYRNSSHPAVQGVEQRGFTLASHQPQIMPRRMQLQPEQASENRARHQGLKSINSLRDENIDGGQSPSGQVRNSHTRDNPLQRPPDSEHQHSPILDYDPEQLSAMDYATLQEQPFDVDPRATPNPGLSGERPLSLADHFKHIMAPERGKKVSPLQAPEKQRQFVSSLKIEQWETFGDLISDGFSDILGRLKVVRQEKRKIAIAFEKEIAEREGRVRLKAGGVENLLNDMKQGGQGLLHGNRK